MGPWGEENQILHPPLKCKVGGGAEKARLTEEQLRSSRSLCSSQAGRSLVHCQQAELSRVALRCEWAEPTSGPRGGFGCVSPEVWGEEEAKTQSLGRMKTST